MSSTEFALTVCQTVCQGFYIYYLIGPSKQPYEGSVMRKQTQKRYIN